MKDLIRETRKNWGTNRSGQNWPWKGSRMKIISNISNWKGRKRSPARRTAERRRARILLAGRELEDQFVTQQMLQQALSQLSEKEQLILSMYYQHEMNLKEIALVLGLTEARICQLNKQIAQKIRDFVYPN